MLVLPGKGSDLTNLKAIQRRAKCKLVTQKTMLSLIKVAEERGALDRVKTYRNTYYCQNKIVTANGRFFSPQCKNRCCTICCGIRKAELINKYLPVLQNWEDPYFVTLTVKAVSSGLLLKRIREMKRNFTLIKAKHAKRSLRGWGSKLIGIRSMECNFNPKYRTYNPHFHFIVPSKEIAETIIDEWLEIWPPKITHRDAQHYRKVEDTEKDLIEVIKYEAKIFTEDNEKWGKKKNSVKIYARALDNIYAAMKGIRLIERFGFNLQKGEPRKKEVTLAEEFQIWEYHTQSKDWLSEDYESPLTAYKPPFDLESILENHIDIYTE